MTGDNRDFPELYLTICRAADANPLAHAALPRTASEIERAVRAAIKDERRNAPLPRNVSFGEPSFSYEFRMTLRAAQAKLRRLDNHIEALTAERKQLAEALEGLG